MPSRRTEGTRSRTRALPTRTSRWRATRLLHPDRSFERSRRLEWRSSSILLSTEAHVSLGLVQVYHEWDWAAAGQSFRHAIELTPNRSDAHRGYGLCLASQGSTDEAVAQTRRALQLDPVNLFNTFAVGWALIGASRYDDLIEHFKRSLEIDPRFVAAHHFIGLGYVGKRRFREGIAEIEKASALSTDNLLALANLGFAYAAAGDKIRAERILDDLEQLAARRYVSPYYLGRSSPASAARIRRSSSSSVRTPTAHAGCGR